MAYKDIVVHVAQDERSPGWPRRPAWLSSSKAG